MPPKKQKEQVLSLEDFASLAGSGGGSGSWADDEAEFTPAFQTSSTLPTGGAGGAGAGSFGPWVSGGTASGAGAGMGTFTIGGGSGARGPPAPIPDSPPYTARVGNVSYEVTEQTIQDFFSRDHHLPVESVRLPRDPEGRVRGSAYVDFTTRDGLVAALKLGGSQILGRTVSVSTVDQRGGSGGGFGGGSFDWSRRAATGPTDGAGLGSFSRPGPAGAGAGAQGDRFDRFRPRNTRPEEPSLNWGSRAGPTDGSGLRPPRSSAPRDAPEPDWSARAGPTTGAAAFRGHSDRGDRAEPASFDWSKRAAPTSDASPRIGGGPTHRERREPELNWSKRAEPSTGASYTPAAPRGGLGSRAPRDGPALDWGKRAPSNTYNSRDSGSRGTSASITPAPSVAPQPKTVDPKITRLQRGFNALQIDDDDDEEESSTPATKPTTEAKSIAEIQQVQRETSNEGWSQA